jgi:hypothetical protein
MGSTGAENIIHMVKDSFDIETIKTLGIEHYEYESKRWEEKRKQSIKEKRYARVWNTFFRVSKG